MTPESRPLGRSSHDYERSFWIEEHLLFSRTFVLPNHTCKEVYVHPMRERVFVKHSTIQMFFHAKFKNWKGEIDEDGTLVQKKS